MRNIILSYTFLSMLLLPLFTACDQVKKEKNILKEIMHAMANRPQQYFEVSFEIREGDHHQIIHQLAGNASLKIGEFGYISNAYFTIEEEDKLNYLQTISDYHIPIYSLEGMDLPLSKASILSDSINSPLKLNPNLLSEWLAEAKHVDILDDDDRDFIAIEFQLEKQDIKVSWNKMERCINSLEVIDDKNYSYKWSFNYLNEAAFGELDATNKLAMKYQNQEFL